MKFSMLALPLEKDMLMLVVLIYLLTLNTFTLLPLLALKTKSDLKAMMVPNG